MDTSGRLRKHWTRYLLAVALVALAAALRIWPLGILQSRLVWVTFYPAITLAALFGGRAAGLVGTLAACVTVALLWPLFVAEPFIKNPADWVGMTVFVLTGSLISSVAEAGRRSELKFRALLESAPDAMVLVNRAGRIELVNLQTERLFGFARDEIIGQPIEALIPVGFHPKHEVERERYFDNPVARPMASGREMPALRKDGAEFLAEISLSPLRADNRPVVCAAIRDVSARQRDEAKRTAMEQALSAATQASELKSRFIANMSHELRTPLNAIIGFAELLHDREVGDITAEQQEFLGDILSAGRHLLHLIGDVLDIAKVESGRAEFRPQHVELAQLIDEVVGVLSDIARRRRIVIDAAVASEVSEMDTDPGRLRQILFNYLSNAVKFTPDGGHITVRALADGDDAMRLEVEDTGIGIRAEDMGKLFVQFQQLDSGVGKKYQGTGLGLALTKQLVEAQGGSVGVRSEPGKGSTFFAVLPRVLRPVRPEPSGEPAPQVETASETKR